MQPLCVVEMERGGTRCVMRNARDDAAIALSHTPPAPVPVVTPRRVPPVTRT